MTETPTASEQIEALEASREEMLEDIAKGKLDQVYQEACIEMCIRMFNEEISKILANG